jgi:site-specific recombinase XerD
MNQSVPQSKSPYDWYQDAVDALMVNGKRPRTAQTYAREVRKFAQWLDKSPEVATEDDLKRFILYRRNECKLCGSSMRILNVGLKFFFEQYAKAEHRLPLVLTRQQVWRIIRAIPRIQNRAYFQTLYSCGLRLSEALHLNVRKVSDTHGVLCRLRS